MNLLILRPGEVDASNTVKLSDARAAHALTVLRIADGGELRIGLLDGPLGIGVVQARENGAITLRCRFEDRIPPRPRVDLLLALPRPKVLRRLWAQVAALGVDRIILTNAERVERNYFDTHLLEPDSYVPLLVEGLQQAKDTRLPRVSVHKRLKVLIEDDLDSLSNSDLRLLADPSADRMPSDIVTSATPDRVLVAIGPEGGWNAFERDLFAAHRFIMTGLGRRTLRTDTACVALLAVVNGALTHGPGDEDSDPGAFAGKSGRDL